MGRLEGKVAIISGAANGMGAEEARLFASEGAKVVMTDLAEGEGQALEAAILEAGGDAMFMRADVTSEADWDEVVRGAVSRYGRVDVLVNNAGLASSVADTDTDTDGWHKLMNVNCDGVFYGSKHVIPAMIESGGGSIVNISSLMGIIGATPGHWAYYASKGAVRNLTKAIAVKYGPQGIRANSVHPGFMQPMTTSRPGTGVPMDQILSQTPLGRVGESIEVANAVLFLASDEASYITGAELVIDGGFLAR